MTLYRETREALLTVASPLPWILLLLSVLSISADVSVLVFLFVFSLVMTFFYLMTTRAVNIIRSNLAKRKDNFPSTNEEYEGSTYWERFRNITHEYFFGLDSEEEPITEYTSRRPFPYLVYSFWGLIASAAAFLVSAGILAWLVTSGNLDSIDDIPLSEEAVQSAPLGLVNFLVSLFPFFDGLSFGNKVFLGGVTFVTGFVFLTPARNLAKVADDAHRRVLQFLVTNNPVVKIEIANVLILAIPYGLYFILT